MITMGHRGAAALEPENTLLSISRAMEIGVGAVEIDVRFNKDNELVVIHDATVDRTTNGTGRVNSYTTRDMRELDAGKGERVPALQEVLDLVRDRVNLFIELKEEGTEGQVAEMVRRNRMEDNVYVISFWHRAVKRLKDIAADIKTGVLLVGCPVDTAAAGGASADAFVMRYTFVNADFVKMAHGKGFEVFIWNIDEAERLPPYADMGVDGIASNDPRVLVDFFGRQGLTSK